MLDKIDINRKIGCPYTSLKNLLFSIKDFFLNKVESLLELKEIETDKKVTFSEWSKLIWLEDISHRIPNITLQNIDDVYKKISSMTEIERQYYTFVFKTLEWFNSDEHIKYNQIEWLLMEKIINEIMDELIIEVDWKYLLYIPEFTDDIWSEIWDEIWKFEEKLFNFFKIKISNQLKNIDKDSNSDIYKLKQIIFLTDKEDFYNLFINAWILANIQNSSMIIASAINGIVEKDWILSFSKFEECILNNSNQLIIDLSRSRSFLTDVLEKSKNIVSYNNDKNSMEFELSLDSYKKSSKKLEPPYNQYKSCPMLKSKSNFFWKNSNKILDFNRLMFMFFLEFYKRNFLPKDTIKN